MLGIFQFKNIVLMSVRIYGGILLVVIGLIVDIRLGFIDIKWFEQGVLVNLEY